MRTIALTAIGDEEVGVFIQSRIACPAAAVLISRNGRKIDRQFQRRRADARNRVWTEDLIGGDSDDFEVDDGDRIVERLADKQLPRRELRCRVVHEHAKPRLDTLVRKIQLRPRSG
jgi:hypothetical protein